jgi:secondary thiamine-phosphate synthase enzyme
MKYTQMLKTHSRVEFYDITYQIKDIVKKSGVKEGIALVYVPHTTAGVTINENGDPDVRSDLKDALGDIVPDIGFRHYEGNSDSHTKTLLTGSSETLIIENGDVVLGTWQSVYFSEYDGPRNRTFFVKIIEG